MAKIIKESGKIAKKKTTETKITRTPKGFSEEVTQEQEIIIPLKTGSIGISEESIEEGVWEEGTANHIEAHLQRLREHEQASDKPLPGVPDVEVMPPSLSFYINKAKHIVEKRPEGCNPYNRDQILHLLQKCLTIIEKGI